MTETKREEEHVLHVFGFPVKLINVPFIMYRGEWMLDVPMGILADVVAIHLSNKPTRLTGNEVRFIRLHFQKSFQAFGNLFDVTKQAVMGWEKAGDKSTKMGWTTEKDIRLFILDALGVSPGAFEKAYKRLREIAPSEKGRPMEISQRDYQRKTIRSTMASL